VYAIAQHYDELGFSNDTAAAHHCHQNLAGWTGSSGGWKTVNFEIDAGTFTGRNVAPQLFFASDGHLEDLGVFVDEIYVYDKTSEGYFKERYHDDSENASFVKEIVYVRFNFGRVVACLISVPQFVLIDIFDAFFF
jgi:hypothetical protein